MSDRNIECEDDLAEALLSSVESSLEQSSGMRIVALLDPAIGDPLSELLINRNYEQPDRTYLKIDITAEERCPYLMELNDGSRILSASAHLAAQEYLGVFNNSSGQPRSVCAWLIFDRKALPPGENWLHGLARRLSALAIVRSPLDGRRVMFRFWDPRLASDVSRLLESEWRNSLNAAGVIEWWHISRAGSVENLLNLRSDESDRSIKNSSWTIDAACWRSLESCGWRNRVEQLMPTWHAVSDDLHLTPEELVIRAVARNLSSEDDVLQFAHCAVTLHPQFDSHPRVAAVLARMQNANENSRVFADHVRQWNEEFRTELRRGQWIHMLNSQDQS